jgi:hypothetical protein
MSNLQDVGREPATAILLKADNPDRLTSRAWLQTLASILAMAVIRRKTRMASCCDVHNHEGSLPASGEGLDLSGEQSVQA